MTEDSNETKQLIEKLENLLKKQDALYREINNFRDEILRLKTRDAEPLKEKKEHKVEPQFVEQAVEIKQVKETSNVQAGQQQIKIESPKPSSRIVEQEPDIKANIEKFIGENLINKIGIAITVIGVAIGTKYAIDHQLISPLTRIILGYLVGIGLLLFAIQLKKKYGNFSAVLLSGSMAIIYFISYAAYSFYGLFPQSIAFILMVIITVFTVTAALTYNMEIIAHIGLVGAYAVPFLLSEGSENVVILLSYVTIINIGILFIAFRKYWKYLYYSSFLVTWLIYLTWYGSKYHTNEHLTIALTFLSVFFVTFYLMFLVYKLIQKEKFDIYDVILLLSNSFIFYGVGYNILTKHDTGEHLLGLYTVGNAIIHFIVSLLIYRQRLADRNLFYLVSGLAIIFITIAIPVQLNGNWITLLWVGEAALLFWIGRTKKVHVYEILSYCLMYLAFFSILRDWTQDYNSFAQTRPLNRITPLFNINFFTSILFIASFGFINFLNNKKEYQSPLSSNKELMDVISFSIAGIFLLTLFLSLNMEISSYFNQLYRDSAVEVAKDGMLHPTKYWNTDLKHFKTIWIINYSLFFFSVLSLVNIRKLKNKNLGYINLALNTIMVVVFLTAGLYGLSELRDSYLNIIIDDNFHRSVLNILIRYISFIFAGIILAFTGSYINQNFLDPVNSRLKKTFDIVLHTSILWMISSEVITWMDIMHFAQSYKLGLSILWGLYALLLVVLGIWKKKKHLRISAIVLFSITLSKLFFYDISHLNTIHKTIIFISLGILLLIISFLYIKYRNIISDDSET
jgi:hypothetical protein